MSDQMYHPLFDHAHAIDVPDPELSDWVCYSRFYAPFRPLKGTEPNRFHRLMYKWLLGITWEKEPEDDA
jgi:hypothetical protein